MRQRTVCKYFGLSFVLLAFLAFIFPPLFVWFVVIEFIIPSTATPIGQILSWLTILFICVSSIGLSVVFFPKRDINNFIAEDGSYNIPARRFVSIIRQCYLVIIVPIALLAGPLLLITIVYSTIEHPIDASVFIDNWKHSNMMGKAQIVKTLTEIPGMLAFALFLMILPMYAPKLISIAKKN